MKFFKLLDKIITKTEKGGFKAANFMHKFAVNTLLLGSGYVIYSSLKGYNETFKYERVY